MRSGDAVGLVSGSRRGDFREQTAARMLAVIVPVFLAGITVAMAATLAAGTEHRMRVVPSLLGAAALLMIWRLARSGRTLPAAAMFAAILGLTILTGMTLNGGVHAPIYALGIALVAYTAWSFGLRAAALCWGAFVLAGGLFVWFGHLGWLRPAPTPPPVMMWVLFSVYMLVCLTLTAIPDRMLRRALDEAEARRVEAEEAERHGSEREGILRESEERFRTLVTNMPGVAYRCVFDADWTMMFISDAVEQLTGWPPGDFIGNRVRSFASIIHPDDAADVLATVAAAVERRESFAVEYRILNADGEERWVYERGLPLFDEAGAVRFLDGVMLDVTDRHQAAGERERLQTRLTQSQKMEAIGTLAGGIAHDFNNILSIMTGYTEVALLKVPKGSPAAENLRQVLAAGERAGHLVTQILTFSRTGEAKPVSCDLGPIVKETVKFMRSALPAGIRIQDRIERVGTVVADPTQMHQVIMNLCTNAFHAMEGHEGTIEVALSGVEIDASGPRLRGIGAGRYAVLTVSDTGCGMVPEVRDRIFEPYFTTKPSGKGTGLGLAVVHGIVTAAGGQIKVYSEAGVGTTFHVYLPVTAQAGETGKFRAAASPEPRGTERVLVVDDETLIVEMQRESLEALGYEVTATTSSEEALRLFRENPGSFDLVLSDLTMPRLGGAALVREMRAVRPGIPVILCTGFSEALTLERMSDLGVGAVLMKPVPRSRLAATIREVFDGRAAP